VDDEWLIVYLLRELSSKFKDAWIRVYDADGEFLLIEAANVLPKWLNPEVAENRVSLESFVFLPFLTYVGMAAFWKSQRYPAQVTCQTIQTRRGREEASLNRRSPGSYQISISRTHPLAAHRK